LLAGADFEVNAFGSQGILQFGNVDISRLAAVLVCHSGGYTGGVTHGDTITHTFTR
jgi:hypothetical protein